ncbi:hypothetical protein MmiHf6_11300 [Methanimicrococcus hongohii]|uniref:GLUG domain-containing protein n=1 Tax=Methanimicrococcus hongohii TaxID=3028295 RepID=A0AA96ZST1_9EURY|nr:hypothetical protein [Methanimicrococcus sp. Hf6]WNY23809.1 hypothetical protein MmiHf6_11300 [Methanimicrococcus sp. Hf6]
MKTWARYTTAVGIVVILTIIFAGTAMAANGNFGGTGDGTVGSPYIIEDEQDLNEIRNHLTGHFKIKDNTKIDIGNSYTTWEPISNFKGTLDGNSASGSEITNLTISGSAEVNGLFSSITNANILNLTFNGTDLPINVIQSTTYTNSNNLRVGILAGSAANSNIENIKIIKSNVTGTYYAGIMLGEGTNNQIKNIFVEESTLKDIDKNTDPSSYTYQRFGGMIGSSSDNISNCIVSKSIISASNSSDVGGMIGQYSGNTNSISDSHTYNITVTGSKTVGGLIGSMSSGTLEESSAQGDASKNEIVTSTGIIANVGSTAGGLLGNASGTIKNSHASINVEDAGSYAGGFVGTVNTGIKLISNCYAEGNVNTTNGWAGGFAGYITNVSGEKITDCYAAGDVSGNHTVGGFVGGFGSYSLSEQMVISNSYATGNVTALSHNAGGFIGNSGNSYIDIIDSYASGKVTADSSAGGFAGSVSNALRCYALGDVESNGGYAGGFAGSTTGNVSQCFSSGDVWTENGYAGGFAGTVQFNNVSHCYATGNASSLKGSAAGFVEFIYGGNITNCYTTGNISGKTQVAGFANRLGASSGTNDRSKIYTIENCMALGSVAVSDETGTYDVFYNIKYGYNTNDGVFYPTFVFQNNFAWNGISNENGDISNQLNENNVDTDDVTLVKSYNIWDTFGNGNNALRDSAWDSSWDSSVWKQNSYSSAAYYKLPVFTWQTIEKQNHEADATYLLYLTQIDIETGSGKTEDSTDFKITVDEKEVEYGKTFFTNWEWNLRAAYSDDQDGKDDNLFVVLKNMDNTTKTYTTEVKDLTAIADEDEIYAWGRAELVGRTGPDATSYIAERFGEAYAFSLDNGSGNVPDNGNSVGSGSGTGGATVVEAEQSGSIPNDSVESTSVEPGYLIPEMPAATAVFSWMLILALFAVAIAFFIYRRREEEDEMP